MFDPTHLISALLLPVRLYTFSYIRAHLASGTSYCGVQMSSACVYSDAARGLRMADNLYQLLLLIDPGQQLTGS